MRMLTTTFKASKAGRLKLIQTSSEIKTVSEIEPGVDLLKTVFENCEIIRTQTFEEIKSRATIQELINI